MHGSSIPPPNTNLRTAGYSLCMVPSQLLLLRVGPAAWLGGIVMLWGAVASSFCMLTSTLQFYFMRFLLGAAESGAFPAMVRRKMEQG